MTIPALYCDTTITATRPFLFYFHDTKAMSQCEAGIVIEKSEEILSLFVIHLIYVSHRGPYP